MNGNRSSCGRRGNAQSDVAPDGANAVGPESAVYFVPDRRLQRRVLDRLIRRGVIVETKPDTYYLDMPAYDRWRRSLRGRVAVLIGGVVLFSAVAALLA